MAGTASQESGVARSLEGISIGQQHCRSAEALAEWRSCEMVENGTPSTSPPYWDTDDEDDFGPKPSELYGKYTWKIDKFSQINKRELRSNAFDVGSYKWYILIYPQGCDVCNHLSLFLCVANHDKLLPGWSHFAQFTIAVVNKDPKKSKYSDTLHRFWKKEHDWGWKKFMELSKVLDGFVEADTLIIKAQVQVIRERADRPFRCLDCQYRRELVRVYLTNVEQICRRFVEERRCKLGKLIEDKARWSSFCAFWLGIDGNIKHRMSREKTDSILKVVVKNFFIEKEVTSTLVMDSLYSGLKALEGQTKEKKGGGKSLEADELTVSIPIVCVEKDMFVLADDVLLLLERAAMEMLPPKEDKGPQNRTKEGGSGEDFNKDSIERDERRLTELGRRTIEIFVLAHIFSKIEVAYQEAVALKRQEELIREEEASWMVENGQTLKRGAEKEKKSKKKQGKQKRNNRKAKDKGRDEKPHFEEYDKPEKESLSDSTINLSTDVPEPVLEKPDVLEVFSDISDSLDCATETLQPDLEDRDSSPVNWDTDSSEVHPPTVDSRSELTGLSAVQSGIGGRRSPSVMDDSSSTCSTDSVPSVVMNGHSKGNSLPNHKSFKSPSRGRNHRSKENSDLSSWDYESPSQPFQSASDSGKPAIVFGSRKGAESETKAGGSSLQDQVEPHVLRKEVLITLQRKLSFKDESVMERPLTEKAFPVQQKSGSNDNSTNLVPIGKPTPECPKQTDVSGPAVSSGQKDVHKIESPTNPIDKSTLSVPPVRNSMEKSTVTSRPLSAPLALGPKLTALVSVVQSTAPVPSLAHSASATGRLGLADPSPATHSHHVPQSYRNAMMGKPNSPIPVSLSPVFSPQNSNRMEPGLATVEQGFSFGMASQTIDCTHRSLFDSRNFNLYKPMNSPIEFRAGTSGQDAFAEEFPHLDIINDLLDDEHGFGPCGFENGPHYLNRQFSSLCDVGPSSDVGPSMSSCRLDRIKSYHDYGYQLGFSPFGDHYDPSTAMIAQADPRVYPTGRLNGPGLFDPVSNQWRMMMGGSSESYRYRNPKFSNIAGGVNGYNVFRPSDGH